MAAYTVTLMEILESGFDINLREYPIFKEEYRTILNKKILDHYYTREIGAETPALFRFWLNRRMNEIMPYYNKLYKSELLEFDPFITNKQVTKHVKNNADKRTLRDDTEHKKDNESTYHTEGESNTTRTRNQTDTEHETQSTTENKDSTTNTTTDTHRTKDYSEQVHLVYSETPQQLVHDGYVADDYYGTTANYNYKETQETEDTKVTSAENYHHTQTNESERDLTDTVKEDETTNETSTVDESGTAGETFTGSLDRAETGKAYEDFIEEIVGLNSVSQSELLDKFRDTFLNIDMLIIRQLADLFMGVYG